jgi:hypothetical protein
VRTGRFESEIAQALNQINQAKQTFVLSSQLNRSPIKHDRGGGMGGGFVVRQTVSKIRGNRTVSSPPRFKSLDFSACHNGLPTIENRTVASLAHPWGIEDQDWGRFPAGAGGINDL